MVNTKEVTMSHINLIPVLFKGQHFFIGIDVHKKRWMVTIRNNNMVIKHFSMNPSPQELWQYMTRHYPDGIYHTVYEAGFCGFWIHEELTKLGFHNTVVHPNDVPTSDKEKKGKTDPIDSRKLARELENRSLKALYVPSKEMQSLRSLCRLYHSYVTSTTRIKNRIKGHLFFYGIELPYTSSYWSRSFIRWLEELSFTHQPARDYLDTCIRKLLFVREQKANILKKLRTYARTTDVVPLLLTVPGVGFKTAITLYCEIMDINRFHNEKQLCSYAGFSPLERSSGEKSFQYGLTFRKNKYLRCLMIESAWVAVRHDPALLQYFQKLSSRMKKQQAIIRISKRLLKRIRMIWINKESYKCKVA